MIFQNTISAKNRILSAVLAASLGLGLFCAPGFAMEARAARRLTLTAAKKTAVSLSDKLEALDISYESKAAAKQNSIKSVAAKRKNLRTFRWSPLLNFKFPQPLDLTVSFDSVFKPLSGQVAMDKVSHKYVDTKIAIQEEVAQSFVTIYTLNKKIETVTERMKILQDTKEKNLAKLAVGEATQSDIDKMDKKLEDMKNSKTNSMRNLEKAKKSLSKLLKMDVTTGFDFEEPYRQADIPRSMLDKLIDYTLENDDTYYSTCLDSMLARIALSTNYDLMNGQYSSSDMNIINSYCRAALNGQEFNAKAFKKSYDRFLVEIDDPWQGNFWILFIPIPKEWIKGSIDGLRYVENDAYALYTSAIDYKSALKEQRNAEEEVRKNVTDAFDNYVNIRATYESTQKEVATAEAEVERCRTLNANGEMTYSEFEEILGDLEMAQDDLIQATADYTKTLYTFDRITCGAVGRLLEGNTIDVGVVGGGQSQVDPNEIKGAYYFINSILSKSQFQLGIVVPQDYKRNITHFELWCDGVMVGDRTAKGEILQHLTISTTGVGRVTLKLYDGDTFIDEVEIDPEASRGPLDVTDGYNVTDLVNDLQVGTYEVDVDEDTDIVTMMVTPDDGQEFTGFKILTEDGQKVLGSGDITPVSQEFNYLKLMETDLSKLKIEYYNDGGEKLFSGFFNTDNFTVNKDP